MNSKEFLGYFLVFLIVLIITSISAIFNDEPNFSDPFNPDFPEITFPENTNQPPSGGGSGTPVGIFQNFIYIILIIAIMIFLYFVITGLKNSGFLNFRNSLRSEQIEIKKRKLEDARISAYQIIEEGLQTGRHTVAYIEAYIALDKGLESFREIMRPKHVTPKEYAFSVSVPVFQAGVFRTVSNYYDIRYGFKQASKGDLLGFKQQLDFLFVEDVPEEIHNTWLHEFENEIKTDYSFKIPRYTDHTKPGGK